MTKNLSVNAITENNVKVIFPKDKIIIEKDEKKILEGKKMSNGLYEVNLSNGNEVLLAEDNKIIEWHRKLEHISSTNLKKLIRLRLVFRLLVTFWEVLL